MRVKRIFFLANNKRLYPFIRDLRVHTLPNISCLSGLILELLNLETRIALSLEEILVYFDNFQTFFHFTGDFPGAIQLLFEAKDAAKTYSHFRAIQQLSHNLQDTLELAEEQLDVALSKVCIDFKESTYARLQVLLNLFKIQIF